MILNDGDFISIVNWSVNKWIFAFCVEIIIRVSLYDFEANIAYIPVFKIQRFAFHIFIDNVPLILNNGQFFFALLVEVFKQMNVCLLCRNNYQDEFVWSRCDIRCIPVFEIQRLEFQILINYFPMILNYRDCFTLLTRNITEGDQYPQTAPWHS